MEVRGHHRAPRHCCARLVWQTLRINCTIHPFFPSANHKVYAAPQAGEGFLKAAAPWAAWHSFLHQPGTGCTWSQAYMRALTAIACIAALLACVCQAAVAGGLHRQGGGAAASGPSSGIYGLRRLGHACKHGSRLMQLGCPGGVPPKPCMPGFRLMQQV